MGLQYRVSLHQGTAAESSLRHNRRNFLARNVDSERTKDNITIKDQDLIDAYKECFGEAIEQYNQKQKRKDRKITAESYLAKIQKNSGKKNTLNPYYEWVVQLGNRETAGVKENPSGADLCKKILEQYARDLEKRTKGHIHIFGCYLHMDETTPHLHIDWIPTAHFERGMPTRNGLEKAVKQMGYSVDGVKTKKRNNRATWQDAERDELVKLAASYGLEAYWEHHEVAEKHLDMDTFRQLGKLADRQTAAASEKAQQAAVDKADKYLQNRGLSGLSGVLSRFKDNSQLVRDIVTETEKARELERESLSSRENEVTRREQEIKERERVQAEQVKWLDNQQQMISRKLRELAERERKVTEEEARQQDVLEQQQAWQQELERREAWVKRYESAPAFIDWTARTKEVDRRAREADAKMAEAAKAAALVKQDQEQLAAAKKKLLADQQALEQDKADLEEKMKRHYIRRSGAQNSQGYHKGKGR